MSQIDRAVAALRAGGLVALPTETVYGLAAEAASPAAVARIYAVKGRPADHPLILHIASAEGLDALVADAPAYARALAEQFWPGPLTLVLRRSVAVGDWVTGGQDTVAVRVPRHELALHILRDFGSAVAAPSANLFGQVSPTTAEHVRADLGPLLDPDRDLIIDGGRCQVGVESTIVDCTGPHPIVLRPGSISAAEIERVAGVPMAEPPPKPPRVSGSLESHYAPVARVILATPNDPLPDSAGAVGLLALATVPTPAGWVRLAAPDSVDDFAHCLYAALREADALLLDTVVAVAPGTGAGDAGSVLAIRDRLTRAATPS